MASFLLLMLVAITTASYMMTSVCSKNTSSIGGYCKKCDVTKILSQILTGYEKHRRPSLNASRPDVVTIGMWILSIDSINILDMDYRIDFFFRQEWTDPRHRNPYPDMLTLSHSMLDNLWLPDTYFVNSKSSQFHYTTIPNKMVRIYPNGRTMFNSRISLSASCGMDLRNFPVDNQECYLEIGSYGYNASHIKYQWEDGKSRVNIGDEKRHLTQFVIRQFKTLGFTAVHNTGGNWSNLKFKFTLKRQAGHYFLSLYSPCVLIVVLSWIAFFIPKDRLVARIGLGIFSVLTCITILNIQNGSMPKVSYIKYSDWYLIICCLFVFGVFGEYTVVLYLYVKEKWALEKERREKKREMDEMKQEDGGEMEQIMLKQLKSGSFRQRSRCSSMREDRQKSEEDLRNIASKPPKPSFQINSIDKMSRIIFPLSFLIVNAIYWTIFIVKRGSDPAAHD